MWLFVLLLVLPTLSVVHEGAHLVAARAVGARARIRWARYGPETIADFPRASRLREAAFFLAGPLANVAVALSALALLGRFGAPVALLHGSYGLGQLLPRKGSDGVQAWRTLTAKRA